MKNRFLTIFNVLIFNLLSLSLVFGIVVNRTDIVIAQANAEDSDSPILTPRETQVEAEADEDDDDGDGNDGPVVLSYVVQPGDNLWGIARQLGVPYQALAAQTDNPRRIYAGQVFTYSSQDLQVASLESSSGESEAVVSVNLGDGDTYTFTVRPGDTLSHIALWLGVPLETLAEQVENPSRILAGQKITYVSDQRIDTPPLLTDNDGTDSDGIDTTGQFTDNDGTDSDGIDTTGQFTDNDGIDTDNLQPQDNQQQQIQRQEQVPYTDNDGTDSDGIDTTGNLTDNDGTDSDGIDTTGNLTDNDGTDSDGIDTTGLQDDTDNSDSNDSDDSDDSD